MARFPIDVEMRAGFYNDAFPDRPPLAYGHDWVTGTWCIGACYKNYVAPGRDKPLYGAYPYGYLKRVHSMFPDAKRVLHVFSGGLTQDAAREAAGVDHYLTPRDLCGRCGTDHGRGDCVEFQLVDFYGPDEGRFPTWQGDVMEMPDEWEGRFDLVLADPPYSADDAEKYGTVMVNRGKVMRALRRVCKLDGNLVWLDQCWPLHQKAEWKTWGHIGLVRSTMHRMRLVSMFRAV